MSYSDITNPLTIQNAKTKLEPLWKNEDWSVNQCHKRFQKLLQSYLYTEDMRIKSFEKDSVFFGSIARVDGSTLSAEQFAEMFDKKCIPCIITDLQNEWPATSKWTWSRLAKKYGNSLFRIGDDWDGRSVKVPLRDYIKYAINTLDDSPLYIFDSDFDDVEDDSSEDYVQAKPLQPLKTKGAKGKPREKRKTVNKTNNLLGHYKVPQVFTEDLFKYLKDERPPFRWFVMGPPRSGSAIHIDPLGTSAWNALVKGKKWWVLIPNSIPKNIVTQTSSYDKIFELIQQNDTYKKKENTKSSTESDSSIENSFTKHSPRKPAKISKKIKRKDEAIDWFERVLPIILKALRSNDQKYSFLNLTDSKSPLKKVLTRKTNQICSAFSSCHDKASPFNQESIMEPKKIYVVLQEAGETIFVPAGWWHAVLNIDYTVCITQNFVSLANIPFAWRITCAQRPKLAKRWLQTLMVHRPQIASLIYNVLDPFYYTSIWNTDGYNAQASSTSDQEEGSDFGSSNSVSSQDILSESDVEKRTKITSKKLVILNPVKIPMLECKVIAENVQEKYDTSSNDKDIRNYLNLLSTQYKSRINFLSEIRDIEKPNSKI